MRITCLSPSICTSRYHVQKNSRKVVLHAKWEADESRFIDFSRRVDLKQEVFKIIKKIVKTNQDIIGVKKIVKTNQDIIGEQAIRNNDDIFGINDENKK